MANIQIDPRLLEKPDLAKPSPKYRKPHFPRELLDDKKLEGPMEETLMLIPKESIEAHPISLEKLQFEKKAELGKMIPEWSRKEAAAKRKRAGTFATVYEYLLFVWDLFKKKVSRLAGRARRRVTRKGEQTLDQIRYLALLCEATSHRSSEEFLDAEYEFGRAYYEIMQLSRELSRMSMKEEEHHIEKYAKSMRKVIRCEE